MKSSWSGARATVGLRAGLRIGAMLVIAPAISCMMEVQVPVLPPANPVDETPQPPPDPGAEQPAPHTRAARLTRLQWERTVQDLLRLETPTGFSSELPIDSLPAGFVFDNPSGSLAIDPIQWAGFQRAAARAAELVTTDATRLLRILPPDGGDEAARARAFVIDFGRRAYRRPLADAEVERTLAVYEVGRTGFLGVAPFTAGTRLRLEAFLQSPFFLYRVEQSSTETDGVIPLDGWEVATRLSYALWNSMPDDVLFEEAAGDALLSEAGVQDAARRMLEDPRAEELLLHTMEQLLQAAKLDAVAPAPSRFPDVPADLGALAREENELFLAHVFSSGGGLTEILTSSTSFANADTAALYGLALPLGDAFEEVELDPSTRRGLLTHLAFLAQNATSVEGDIIHRGVFVATRLACLPIAAPPANIPPLPADDGTSTNRQRVEAHTEQPGSACSACHSSIINPFGYPFEIYDATGQLRNSDNGQAIDSSAVALLDGAGVAVSDAVDLSERLAASDGVHACFAQHWLEASLGRPRAAEDEALITRLTADSLSGQGIRDLLATLVASPGFRARSTAELGGAP